MRRLLFVAFFGYFDDGEAAMMGRVLVEGLSATGLACEVLCVSILEIDRPVDPVAWLTGRGLEVEDAGGAVTVGARGVRVELPAHLRTTVQGVPVTVQLGPSTTPHEPDDAECSEFARLLEAVVDRFRPEVLVVLGGGRLGGAALALGRSRGIATVLKIDDPERRDAVPPGDFHADVALVPSRFAADYVREAFGVSCEVLPPLLGPDRPPAERTDPRYLTYIDPTAANGVYFFARLAHELGRSRPDIPILVVEGRGSEGDLAACGLDLAKHGNLSVMPAPNDPRDYWAVTRAGLLPTLGWEAPARAVAEAMAHGVPMIAADRGGLPEAIGGAGIVLPIPDRLTPATRTLPTPEEVAPWVEAVVRIWDDEGFARDRRRRALAEARRQAQTEVAARYRRFFEAMRPKPGPIAATPPGRARSVVLVPHLNGIDWECEQGLRRLEDGGVKVVRRAGSSAIDAARNEMISHALHDGFESMMFIDADIGFEPSDVFRLLARPESVVCGTYAKKGRRGLASMFAEDVGEVVFGPTAPGLYPVRFAATGFLRIKAAVLRRMIADLELPLCNTKWGRGSWPFFMPMIVPHGEGRLHYLGEDWAFSHRLSRIGVTPMADTSIRLWHWGRYGYGWEDAGADRIRHRSYNFRLPKD